MRLIQKYKGDTGVTNAISYLHPTMANTTGKVDSKSSSWLFKIIIISHTTHNCIENEYFTPAPVYAACV